jgi:hypothetical protein
LILVLVAAFLAAGCKEPTIVYSSMDREVTNGTVSPSDLIDQSTLSIGNGITPREITITTFNPEWYRCRNGSVDTELQTGMNVSVTNNLEAPLFILDSFYGAKAIAVRTDLGAEYYKRFRIYPGTELFISDGPYCFGKATWWFVTTKDTSAVDNTVYLFGLVPESGNGVRFFEPSANNVEQD